MSRSIGRSDNTPPTKLSGALRAAILSLFAGKCGREFPPPDAHLPVNESGPPAGPARLFVHFGEITRACAAVGIVIQGNPSSRVRQGVKYDEAATGALEKLMTGVRGIETAHRRIANLTGWDFGHGSNRL